MMPTQDQFGRRDEMKKEEEGAGSGRPSPGPKTAREIKCGDLYFADRGQSSHSYPTLWVVLSSKSALEPNHVELQADNAEWYAAHGACGPDLDFHRGLNPNAHGWPGERAVIYTNELREMVYLGNLYEDARTRYLARSAPSPQGEGPSQPRAPRRERE